MADDLDQMFDVFEQPNKQQQPAPAPLKPARANSKKKAEVDESLASKTEEIIRRRKAQVGSDTFDDAKRIKSLIAEEMSALDQIPRIQVHKIDTLQLCTHEVAIPPDSEYVPLRPAEGKPAKEYPFVLDPFQKEAILCLENEQSVLVSAHTSAGKTVVAEYAIAMSLRAKQRVIYTSPIKALSNQKYRELSEEFTDVGLMTGDVTINPTASCLVMTTEILRSMLYRGSEIMREVAWVIFDEIHYMRDKERGVVWEETIILLPDNVHYVFLSATIPNASQFAEWICHLHRQPCHVVYTDYRPTPLQHYIYPHGGDGLHLVVDENGEFREQNFTTAMSVLKDAGDAGKGEQRGRKGGMKGESSCFKIVKMIMERNFAPVIVFSFSKKDCEAYALQMTKLDLNSAQEKVLVDEVFKNAIDALSEEDRKLPQVEHVLPLLRKGIGIHHSGLLPILKETIEILFSEGLIKALFATETFAMGLNMPARTVLFTSARKFDGKDFRWITSGEYIQMSGRAGRRGLDDRGIVILMVDTSMSAAVGKALLKGKADPLNSAFHLTYNMVLNLLRVEEINPEYMLERSFFQFQNYAAIPELQQKLRELEARSDAIVVPNEDQVAAYYRLRQQLDALAKDVQSYIRKPQYLLPFLQPGRLVRVCNGADNFGWGVVVNFQKKANQGRAASGGNSEEASTADKLYIVDVVLHVTKESAGGSDVAAVKPPPAGVAGEMQVVPIMLDLITQVSSLRLYIPHDLRPTDNRLKLRKMIQEVERRYPKSVPLLDPIEDMRIEERGLIETVRKIEALEQRLFAHPLSEDPAAAVPLLALYDAKVRAAGEVRAVKAELKKKRSLLQMDELKCRKRVLRRLGYATPQDVIERKGRVACEISSADELLITELMFNGAFNDLTVAQMCALVSCFVFEEKGSEVPKLTEELSGPLRLMQDTARRIARVSAEAKLEIDEQEYVAAFKPHMMDVVAAWVNGSSFAQICKMTDIFEGSVIRCMRRLEETLRQLCQAAKAIGNADLENKFADGIAKIKRDIVFAASLYL